MTTKSTTKYADSRDDRWNWLFELPEEKGFSRSWKIPNTDMWFELHRESFRDNSYTLRLCEDAIVSAKLLLNAADYSSARDMVQFNLGALVNKYWDEMNAGLRVYHIAQELGFH